MRAIKKPVGMRCLLGFCSSHLSYGLSMTLRLARAKKAYLAVATCQTEQDEVSHVQAATILCMSMYSPSSS
jgi:hypothetical protein